MTSSQTKGPTDSFVWADVMCGAHCVIVGPGEIDVFAKIFLDFAQMYSTVEAALALPAGYYHGEPLLLIFCWIQLISRIQKWWKQVNQP